MGQAIKRLAGIAGSFVIAVTFLITLLLILQTDLPSRAAFSEPCVEAVAMSRHAGNGSGDILPKTGAYHGGVIDLERIDEFECMAGKKLTVVKIYQHFHNGDFYENFAEFIRGRGAIEFLSFDPTVKKGEESVDLRCCEVLSGDYEVLSSDYVSIVITFARHIKAWGHPLILSFVGEMNGNWAGWSGAYNFGDNCVTYTAVSDLYGAYGCTDTGRIECADGPERYRKMYRHVYDIFADEGVTNVTWAWVVNHASWPITNWNQIENYYPGDEYVDIISIDGYNWGDDGPGGCQGDNDPGWKTFDQVFSTVLTSLSDTHPTKPLILGEFASVEGTDPMSKANWITDAYRRIKLDWPQIKAAVWYNLPDTCSFPIESSPESRRAYREAIADPYFIGDPVWCSYLPLACKPLTSTLCTDSGRGGTETISIEPPRTIGGIHVDLIERALQDYGFSLWEVEIYGPGNGNLAIGAKATASSSQDSPGCLGCSPDKAIDGDMNTRWASSWSEPQWFSITLPAPQVVNRIVLKWEAAYAKKYCVTVIE